MKILFLDFDGVLNLQMHSTLDPVLVSRLCRVLDVTGASVVVSSSWRVYGLQRVRDILFESGMPSRLLSRLIDVTPHMRGNRGAEIAAWLRGHPEVEQFAIVDDMDDMGPLHRYLVQTSMGSGLTGQDADALVIRLGAKLGDSGTFAFPSEILQRLPISLDSSPQE